MPTLIRQPGALGSTTSHLVVTERAGGTVEVGALASPPEELLPSGGTDRSEAGKRRGAGVGRTRPGLAFERRVRVIHRQLLPLQSRAALASSYDREAAHWKDQSDLLEPVRAATALHLAYALRWLELADPTPTPPSIVDGRAQLEG